MTDTPEDQKKNARLFKRGRWQAVPLPTESRFEDTEVRIRRHGAAVVPEPVMDDGSWRDASSGAVDADYEQAALERPGKPHRPELENPSLSRSTRLIGTTAARTGPLARGASVRRDTTPRLHYLDEAIFEGGICCFCWPA
jgi:antitoxin VapB